MWPQSQDPGDLRQHEQQQQKQHSTASTEKRGEWNGCSWPHPTQHTTAGEASGPARTASTKCVCSLPACAAPACLPPPTHAPTSIDVVAQEQPHLAVAARPAQPLKDGLQAGELAVQVSNTHNLLGGTGAGAGVGAATAANLKQGGLLEQRFPAGGSGSGRVGDTAVVVGLASCEKLAFQKGRGFGGSGDML